jgi:3-methyl-2-oxobutanoate hydroxymethyltransferase
MPKERLTVPGFRALKRAPKKIKMVTSYDFTGAILADKSPVDALLVGDSLGMVMLGYSSTTGVTMDEIIHHLKAVVKGAPNTFTVADMPFGSYNVSPQQAVTNANELIKAGADGVKLEGGIAFFDTVRTLVRAGIPVMGHIGLTPQTAASLGGWKVQGRDAETARQQTGYVRGTITPLGSTTAWPVVMDLSMSGKVSVGGGAHGVALTVDAQRLAKALDATVADVTEASGS